MVNETVVVAYVVLAVFCVYLLYQQVSGCSGGHVWSDWEETNRVKTVPVDTRPGSKIAVQREKRRHCQRGGCSAEDSKWTQKYVTSSLGDNGVVITVDGGSVSLDLDVGSVRHA